MGANIALLRYFVRKLRINEQSICKVYKLPNTSEQHATVSVMRDSLNCRDGIYEIEYLNYDEITVTIDELCTNYYVLYIISFVFIFTLCCVL